MTQDPRDLPGGAADGAPPADPVWRRMLDAAPDRDAAPRPATREAILRSAHNAVAPSPLAIRQPRESALPWWKRLGGSMPGSRMPWKSAFATALVAMFVTVLWHREPVPDARLDAEAPASSPVASAPASGPAAPSSPTPPVAAPATAEPAPAARSAPAPRPSVTPLEREPAGRAAREDRRSAVEADTSVRKEATRPAAKAQAESMDERTEALSPPSAPVAPAPPMAAPPVADAKLAPSPSPSPSPSAGSGAAAGASAPPAAALTPAPARETAPPVAALARRPQAAQAQPGAWRVWTHLRVVDASGQSRRLARVDAAQLGALVEAAIPAQGGGAAAGALAPGGWRIVLEGPDGAALGVLEVPGEPGRSLRWRAGTAPPVAAEPPSSVLETLRRALAER